MRPPTVRASGDTQPQVAGSRTGAPSDMVTRTAAKQAPEYGGMWKFEFTGYRMACEIRQLNPTAPATIIVTENRTELHREEQAPFSGEDVMQFTGRIQQRVWDLQERFRPQATAAYAGYVRRLITH